MDNPQAFLLANPDKPDAMAAYGQLTDWLSRRGQLCGSSTQCDSGAIRDTGADRVIVLGGDGTLLATARCAMEVAVPIAGVNMGKLGYLAAFSREELMEHFDRVMGDPELVSERMCLRVRIESPGNEPRDLTAINDCVLHVGPPFRMLGLELSVDGEFLTTIMGDGLIIATPTGSTAHNMSAGGPILEPEVDAIVLTPICPHTLAHRPVVFAQHTTLRVHVVRAYEGSTAMIDGQIGVPCPADTVLTITRCDHPFELVRHPDRTSWQALVRKLRWGLSIT